MTVSAAPPMNFDIGRVVSRLLGTVGRNFLLFLSLAVLLVGLPGAMLAFAQISLMGDMFSLQGSADPNAALATLFSPLRIGLGVAGFLIGIVGNAALQGAVIHASISDLSGKRATFGECLTTGLRFFLPLFCIGLIVGICCFFGYLVFIVPGVLLGLAWCMAAPAEVVERTGIFAALSRSADLTRNHRGAIFGLIIIFFVVLFIIQTIINAFDTMALGFGGATMTRSGAPDMRNFIAIQSVVAVVLQVVISSLASAGLASIYFELRQTKEGVGAEQLAAVFD
jgi:MFS family permease